MSAVYTVHVLTVLFLLWTDAFAETFKIAKKCTNEWMGTVSLSCEPGTMLEVDSAVHYYSDDSPTQTWPAVGARQACGRSPSCMILFSIFWLAEKNEWIRCYRVKYTCTPVKCPEPVAPPSGKVQFASTTLGSVVQYSCDEGYQLIGSNLSMCVFKGKYYEWSAEAPICEIAYNKCPSQSSSQHSMGAHGSMCYEFVLEDRVWSAASTDCRSRGGALVSVDSMDFLKTAFITSPPLKFSDAWGYFWTGKQPGCSLLVVNVQDSKHHHNVQPDDCQQKNHYICQYEPKLPERCVSLVPPENGLLSTDNTSIGAVVQFTCAEGYRLEGVDTRRCLVSGLWSAENPSCAIVDCGKPKLVGNDTVTKVTFNQTTYLSYAAYSCPAGYKLIGSESRMCAADGAWTAGAPYCQIITTSQQTDGSQSQTEVMVTEELVKKTSAVSLKKTDSLTKPEENVTEAPVLQAQDSYISYKSLQHNTGQTTDAESGGNFGLVLPIVLTVILLVAIVIFILIILIRRHRRQRQKKQQKKAQGKEAYMSLASDCLDASACSASANSELLVENAV